MKFTSFLATAAVAFGIAATPATAATVILDVSGVAGSAGAYTGVLTLTVDNGLVSSATGTLSIAGLVNAPLALITTSTPGNENNDPYYPVGFRANDGTDLFGADQRYGLDIGGLLFAVDTTTPSLGSNALINFYNDSGPQSGNTNVDHVLFNGIVRGVEYYNQTGSLNIVATEAPTAAVPEPASWAMLIIGMGAVGYASRRRQKVTTRIAYAA